MTTLFLKNNSIVEVSFVVMTTQRNDPLYTQTLFKGCGCSIDLGEDSIIEIITDDYYTLKKIKFTDVGNHFPDNEIIIHRLDNYHTEGKAHILAPDNTLIGVEMRDGSKGKIKPYIKPRSK